MELSEEITSVQNAVIFNETKWFAIEETIIEFKCKKGFNLVTNSKEIYLQNSIWDQRAIQHDLYKSRRQSKQNSNLFVCFTYSYFDSLFQCMHCYFQWAVLKQCVSIKLFPTIALLFPLFSVFQFLTLTQRFNHFVLYQIFNQIVLY